MAENVKDLEMVRSISRKLIVDNFSDEEPYFNIIWQVMSSLIQKWQGIPPEEWPLGGKSEVVLDKLGLVGQTQEFITPTIIGVVTACFSHVLGSELEDPDRQIPQTIDTYATNFELKGKPKKILMSQLPSLLKDMAKSLPGAKRPRVGPPEKEYNTEEISRKGFTFNDKLEINWKLDSPLVKLNDKEILAFKSQEISFITLLYLTAARKKGKGWLYRSKDLLDPKADRISSLRDIFSLVGLKGIPMDLARLIIKSDRQGRVRLALKRNKIGIGPAVFEFTSIHEDKVNSALVDLASKLEEFEERREKENFIKLISSLQGFGYYYKRYINSMELLAKARTFLNYEFKCLEKFEEIKTKAKRIEGQIKEHIEDHRELYERLLL